MKDYVATALQYARGVVAGEIPACKWTIPACERQLKDIERQQDPNWPYRFDEQAAIRVCEFIEMLPHIKGKWARHRLCISLDPWQCFLLVVVFGWLHKQTGLRRFREVYVEVPRKNAKSTISSGVALYMLTADDEQGAEVYSAATTREQARIVFDVAKSMAERSPDMQRHLGVQIMQHTILVPHTASKFAPLSAEGSNLDGLNVHFAVVDELHAHKTRAVYDVIDTGRGAREQSILWCITTAGTDRAGICYERRTHVTKMLDGVIEDESLFGVIYTIDDGDDPHDAQSWAKANPNWMVSVLPDDMEAASRKAAVMPSAMNNFLTKRLNVWCNADSSWMDMRAWDQCANTALRAEHMAHLRCVIGLDLASKKDVAAKIKIWYDPGSSKYCLIPSFYLPEDAVESSGNSQYSGWVRAGHLVVTDGNVIDFDLIEDHLIEDVVANQVGEVAYDPFQATQLASHMLERNVPMVEYRQTVQNMSEPMKQLEALVLQGKLEHDGNPMMTWMISNVVCHTDVKDNIYPRKERPENKIDGAVAAIMALGRHIAGQDKEIIYSGELVVA